MKLAQKIQINKARRKARIRAKINGTAERPRLTVFKSNKYIYVQIIDDTKGRTLVSASSQEVKNGKPAEKAVAVGAEIAKKAKAAKIAKVVFDRNGYIFGGKIKAVADAARKEGLEF